ncbi:MAG: twin arginine-targeting protein translocase TatB [Rhizobiales bacterium 62-17]|nr:twin-arginine translocase subunit TatB [Hyphomicrobiales bacterium]OJY05862.1 MAG: twin arginine-targeting protein translocase TatB [Rhizobiales bacterium 62-17]
MFDFDATKLIIIGIAALVFIGPKDLPRVMRQVGGFVAKMRRMASEFQGQFMEAMKESEMEELKKDMQKIADQAKTDIAFDPGRETERELREALEKKPETAQAETHPDTHATVPVPVDPDSPTFNVEVPSPPETPDVAKAINTAEASDKPAVETQPQKVAQGS